MTEPVLPSHVAPPALAQGPITADGVEASRVESAGGCVRWTIALTVLVVFVCGGLGVLAWGLLDAAKRRFQAQVDEMQAAASESAEAGALLEDVADRLRLRFPVELPTALPEAAPKDPWGNPIRYERRNPRRARLTSAGPDGEFGNSDDVRCSLDLDRP